MELFRGVKDSFENEIRKRARINIERKLRSQGISPNELSSLEYEELLQDEMEILRNDVKKVGLGFGLGVAFSLFFGF